MSASTPQPKIFACKQSQELAQSIDPVTAFSLQQSAEIASDGD